MNTKFFTTAIMAALALSANAVEVTETQESTDSKNLKLSEVFSKPKLSGYMIGNYNATFKDNGNSNGFSLRMIRLIMTGRVLGDFEYKLQGQINGNTGTYGDSPRLIDMSVEWQKYKGFKIKAGQFKRPFTFENPMNPIDIGFTTLNQNVMSLSGFSDRTGEQASNGRDIGVQLSGDLLPNGEGRTLLHYEVGMFNGQGLNQKEVDNQKDIIGGAWVSPLKGVRIGAFGWVGSYARKGTWTDDQGKDMSGVRKVGRYRYAISAEYKDADWQIRSEYIHNTGGAFATRANKSADLQDCSLDTKLGDRADGVYLALVAPVIRGKLRAKARYDLYRLAGEWGTAKIIYKAGINYLFCKNLEIQTEYSFVNDRSLADHNYSMADVQFSVRF